jgi:hypothetical protein
MLPKIVMDHPRRSFFCWRHHKHYTWSKLGSCLTRGCLAMCLPLGLAWKSRGLGLLVPMPSPPKGIRYAS